MELKTKIESGLLPFVSKPARYFGNEYNTVLPASEDVDLRIGLCFPDIYEVGVREVALEVTYHFLNDLENYSVERFFAPAPDAENRMKDEQIPLFSMETRRELIDFDVLLFFLTDPLTYTNVLTMLALGAVPFRAEARQKELPLLMAMGPAVQNPEPVAAFFDVMTFGEDLQPVAAVLQRFTQQKGGSREAILSSLSAVRGAYLPAQYEAVYSNYGDFQALRRLGEREAASALPEENQSRIRFKPLVPLVDLVRGRVDLRPFGSFSSETKPDAGATWQGHRLFNRSGRVISAAFYGQFRNLLKRSEAGIADKLLPFDTTLAGEAWLTMKSKALLNDGTISFSAKDGSVDFGFVKWPDAVAQLKKERITLYPLAASGRLRSRMNVDLREDELLNAVKAFSSEGWKRIRLCFTIGLPTETPNDVLAIVTLVEKCRQYIAEDEEADIDVAVNVFCPHPHSPLQWEQQALPGELSQKMRDLSERLQSKGIAVQMEDPNRAGLLAALARGDRRLSDVIETAWKSGARFDNARDLQHHEAWQQAFEVHELARSDYLKPISITVPLPWDHMQAGPSRGLLKEEKLTAGKDQLNARSRNIVSLGDGIAREELEKLWRHSAISSQTRQTAGLGQPSQPISYGRRGKRRHAPEPVIKRRIRVRYAKNGLARFFSHSDIIKVFDRSARLAKIPLVYSQSVRPSPKISYGLPLVPGIASIAEYLDMEVEMGREVDIQACLNDRLPDGMKVLQYKGLYAKVPSLASIIDRASYKVLLSGYDLPDAWIEEWLASSEVRIRRPGKDGARELNIRPYISLLEKVDDQLMIAIDVIEGRTANITEFLDSFWKVRDIDYRRFWVQRTEQCIVKEDTILTPLDIV